MNEKENIIEVNKVSMRFNLGIEKGFSIKQGFVDLFNSEKRKNKIPSKYLHNRKWILSAIRRWNKNTTMRCCG